MLQDTKPYDQERFEIMKSLWIPAKTFVVAALLLGSAAVLVAGDGDCNNNNPSKLNKFYKI